MKSSAVMSADDPFGMNADVGPIRGSVSLTRSHRTAKAFSVIAATVFASAILLLIVGSVRHDITSNDVPGYNPLQPIVVTMLVVSGLLIYTLPTVIAYNRDHENLPAIAMTNLLFGWTFLGWGIAIIWAFTSNVRESRVWINRRSS